MWWLSKCKTTIVNYLKQIWLLTNSLIYQILFIINVSFNELETKEEEDSQTDLIHVVTKSNIISTSYNTCNNGMWISIAFWSLLAN